MFKRTVSSDNLFRLKQNRETADLAYNDALTALDQILHQLHQLPKSPNPVDETSVQPLNELWNLQPKHSNKTGWKTLIRSITLRIVAPLIGQQQAFNSAIVDHLNRTSEANKNLVMTLTKTIEFLHNEMNDLDKLESRLISYAQSLTPYIDTKDHEISGLMRRINEDIGEVTNDLDKRIYGLSGAIGGVSDELQKRWESMVARERRFEASVDEFRATSAGVQRISQALKRELSDLKRSGNTLRNNKQRQHLDETNELNNNKVISQVDHYKYVAFEDLFRGPDVEILSRLSDYVAYFEGASDVLDVGCGRGEFLKLLNKNGISSYGVDLNRAMIEECKENGLNVKEIDLLTHLKSLSDNSLGGLFAAQVVEHLEPAYLLEFIDTAFHKLRPGSKIILETINVASWSAFFQSYIRDITHIRPLHPETLSYFVTVSGFQKINLIYRSPCAKQNKLEEIQGIMMHSRPLEGIIPAINRNVEKLNSLLFGNQDYAVIAERP
jgi:2-polyprenyl-3-methyl-5-hydroxy-6-metoxy-1,4-benzoquinol methylase/uncharacterized membrane-anchored protein YhcB (DUF1043 family)